jgi:hypothetical protein
MDMHFNATRIAGAPARSTWTIHPLDAESCTLTVDASLRTGQVQAWC